MWTAVVIGALLVLTVLLERMWSARDRKRNLEAKKELADAQSMGDVAPASLHPVVDPYRCIGSGACVAACPEHDVIGLVDGRAALLNPLACIGHGACMEACPVEAIKLVFGTETRGLELPRVDPHFQTNQPGLYVVGELGGMGLIRNAVSQGRQAAEHVAAGARRGSGDVLDAIVVGAGPAGISASLKLMEAGRSVMLLEREDFGGTIAHYPRKKLVMTGGFELAMYGAVKRNQMTKEELAETLDDVRQKTGLAPRTGEQVTDITRAPAGHFAVRGTTGTFEAANVLLALGRRGSPMKLGVPGEELDKVFYRLLEPAVFAGQHVLVVGGGNSAVECALALLDSGVTKSLAISYRRETFARCRAENRRRIDEAIAGKKIHALLPTEVKRIAKKQVELAKAGSAGAVRAIPNDAVIVQIGGTSPSDLLGKFGIEMVTKFGEA